MSIEITEELALNLAKMFLRHNLVDPQTLAIDNTPTDIAVKLNNDNYPVWATLMKRELGGKGLTSHITADPKPPLSTDPSFPLWQQSDHRVFIWIILHMNPSLVNLGVAQYPTAKHLWDGLATMYGSDSDSYRMYELYRDAYSIKQNGGSLDSIWNRFQEIWFEMDCRKPNPMTCSECRNQFHEYVQTERLFQFLMAIDDRFESVRRKVLLTDPLPSLTTAYAMVRRETEIQMQVREDKSKLVCSHCGGRRHDKDSCFYLIGFPEWWEGPKKMKPSTASGIRQPQSRQPMAISAYSMARSANHAEAAKPTYGGFFREIGTAVSNITEEEEYTDEEDLWFWH
ncbi:uncharacterized protein LOC125204717 [Salvia hispanica]|uniref:uncharacterized protein LOC125204717 n=1 Tax=Salvia hispanica TaxID=49212 RepID=UPI002009052C|nr:uncharacterized protein LOC125204717 [Salvia hispanica]